MERMWLGLDAWWEVQPDGKEILVTDLEHLVIPAYQDRDGVPWQDFGDY